MHALRPSSSLTGFSRFLALFTVATLLAGSGTAYAQGKKKNPASKVFFADVNGDTMIDTGDSIQDVAKRSVYTAQGTTIETKKSEPGDEANKSYSTAVYSNGTGAFFDSDTRVEVKNFVQEPFSPNRSDVDVEPSISQTSAFVSRGAVGLCTSKLVAGSVMSYQTPHGSVNIRGRKVVIEAQNNVTKISMLEGESTVRGGTVDMGGHILHAGEQALIRAGRQGEANEVEIRRIPPDEAPALDEKITIACNAKKTVYFEIRDKSETNGGPASGGTATGSEGEGRVSAFDGDSNSATNGASSGLEIVPVEIVPINLPTQYTETPTSSESLRKSGG